eukprot:2614351-Pleurochrysis_carterae.AAC.2
MKNAHPQPVHLGAAQALNSSGVPQMSTRGAESFEAFSQSHLPRLRLQYLDRNKEAKIVTRESSISEIKSSKALRVLLLPPPEVAEQARAYHRLLIAMHPCLFCKHENK